MHTHDRRLVLLRFLKERRAKNISWKEVPIRSSARRYTHVQHTHIHTRAHRAVTGKDVDDVDLMHWVKIHNLPDYR